MTPSQINQAIAELCGWEHYPAKSVYSKRFGKSFDIDEKWKAPDSTEHDELRFTTSLDACAEFEGKMDDVAEENYTIQLNRLIQRDNPNRRGPGVIMFLMATATPLQRCEAYLRMKGKWV